MKRRTFLAVGVVGGAALALAGSVALVTGRDAAADRDAVLGAVVPALLAGALPDGEPQRRAAIDAALGGTRAAIAALAPAARNELGQLFAILASAPGRRVLAGVQASSWSQARTEDVAAFLQRWRGHRLATLRVAYLALHDLVLGSWYADPAHWQAIGYAGPPAL